MTLSVYRKRRNFAETPEPKGPRAERRARSSAKRPNGLFVIQKHHASHKHYDLRLELDGVLKSWAVPKGPSLDPADKRLAVEVEDHPLEYGSFEGTIPAGQYGAGSVLLWDRGRWAAADGDDPAAAYKKGRLKFTVEGKKLRGAWMLVRMGGSQAGAERRNWLWIKEADEYARRGGTYDITEREPRSVASGRLIEEIGNGAGKASVRSRKQSASATKHGPKASLKATATKDRNPPAASRAGAKTPRRVQARRSAAEARPSRSARTIRSSVDPSTVPGARRSPQPSKFEPQLATLRAEVPAGDEWLHEVKFDGYRVVCLIEDGRARLITRKGHDWSSRFTEVRSAIDARGFRQGILDGEIVALNEEGISQFQRLQRALQEGHGNELVYYVFDVPHWGGFDLTECRLADRQAFLHALLASGRNGRSARSSPIRLSEGIAGRGPEVLRNACDLKLEGVVSKRADTPYISGRTTSWIKIRCSSRQEMLVGGFTEPRKSRTGFGALLLGYYDRSGKLVYAGKVGTGFDEHTLSELHRRLKALERDSPPFAGVMPRQQTRGAHWVSPKMVVEISFTEWTADGRLRHPVFPGVREDKDPRDVVRESASLDGRSSKRNESGGSSMRHSNPPRRAPVRQRSSARAGRASAHPAESSNVVGGVTLTHPDRVVFAEVGLTKLEIARYYEAVAGLIMPHARDRPLSVLRCPSGSKAGCFYQKHFDVPADSGLRGVPVKESDGTGIYAAVHEPRGLIWLVQQNALELHGWGARDDDIERPDRLVFDLDPGESVAWSQTIDGARRVQSLLGELGLTSFVKTTGGKGLHVVVPIQRRIDWATAKSFTRAVADRIVAMDPGHYIATMSKAQRRGKVFIDYLRNQRGATSVLPYSTRARAGAPVSMPVEWDDLERIEPAGFSVTSGPDHIARRRKDPWRDFERTRQTVTQAMVRAVARASSA